MDNSKEDKIFKIALAIFKMEMREGHLKWKITELEKISNVSRPLIYRYLGKNKKEVFENALRFFLETFYGFNQKSTSKCLSEEIVNARRLMIEHYEAVIFYQKWRNSFHELREIFINVENRFKEKIRKAHPKKSRSEQLSIYVFIHGLVTSPFLSLEECEELCQKLNEEKHIF